MLGVSVRDYQLSSKCIEAVDDIAWLYLEYLIWKEAYFAVKHDASVCFHLLTNCLLLYAAMTLVPWRTKVAVLPLPPRYSLELSGDGVTRWTCTLHATLRTTFFMKIDQGIPWLPAFGCALLEGGCVDGRKHVSMYVCDYNNNNNKKIKESSTFSISSTRRTFQVHEDKSSTQPSE